MCRNNKQEVSKVISLEKMAKNQLGISCSLKATQLSDPDSKIFNLGSHSLSDLTELCLLIRGLVKEEYLVIILV